MWLKVQTKQWYILLRYKINGIDYGVANHVENKQYRAAVHLKTTKNSIQLLWKVCSLKLDLSSLHRR